METIDALKWIRENGLYPAAEHGAMQLKKIFTPCLAANTEPILIIGDTAERGKMLSPVVSAAYYLAAKDLKLNAKLVLQSPKEKGEEAEQDVVSNLASLREGIIILNLSNKMGSIGDLGKSFRKFVKKHNHRFISAMGLGDLDSANISVMLSAIDVPYKPMQAQHEKVKKLFDEAKDIHITTPAGTDLHYSVEGIDGISADGNYTMPGTGGNLPAGEVYAPPNGTKVEGKIVVDGSMRTHLRTILPKKPVTLIVENGSITEIQGGAEAKELEATLEWAASKAKNPGGIRRICEFGIGLNPRAQIMGAMIIDDKSLGTAHIGIGSNYWFGGSIYSIIHLDQVFKNPAITFDGKKLLL